MSRRPRQGRQQRPRKLSPRLIVVGEGARTEYEYLTRLNQSLTRPQRPALKVSPGKGCNPVDVVRAAVTLRKKAGEDGVFLPQMGDRVFALLDVEPHDPSKADSLGKALRLAQEEKIEVLLSNPSFEFWLLCHFAGVADLCRSFDSPAHLDRELKKRCQCDKDSLNANPRQFEKFLPKASEAVRVARLVHQNHHGNVADVRSANACTEVYRLVAYLIGKQDELH